MMLFLLCLALGVFALGFGILIGMAVSRSMWRIRGETSERTNDYWYI